MKNNMKNFIISIGFVAILITVFIANVVIEDTDISTTERRKLAQFPEITTEKILNGDVMDNWEEYVIDQFVGRDFFRSIKTFCSIKILKQKDSNGLFEEDGAIYKMQYPLNITNVTKTAEKINKVYETYLQDMNVYYAIITDKNYYLENDDHLKIDYGALKEIIQNNLVNIQYIDIWDCLTLEDYYKTDAHWKQENLKDVVIKIEKEMNLQDTRTIEYIVKSKGDFYGGYYGQLGMNLLPDKLNILTNETIENCVTYNYETKKTGTIYTESQTSDKYDIYLEGATPIIEIKNPNTKTQKELLLFRDSYGSSLAPLLAENYSKITLIDIRYISSSLLEQYIHFEKQDVLFLYSTLVLNQNVLK